MKRRFKLLIAAASVAAAAPLAAQVHITGSSDQVFLLIDAVAVNRAEGDHSNATQSMSTNAGQVRIAGYSFQDSFIGPDVIVRNVAKGNRSEASQNISTNSGDVTIGGGGDSEQITDAMSAEILNRSDGVGSHAAQNLSSNFGTVTINGLSLQTSVIIDATTKNEAIGSYAIARQNMATNTSCGSDCR